MSLKLILMRHAKSDWDDPMLSDHQRPLNKRGCASAKAMGDWLRERGHLPDLVLSSDSTRTQETWERLALTSEVRLMRSLYLAPAMRMLEVLRQAGEAQTVLMLGHNPGIGDLAQQLAATDPRDDGFYHYPTCATTVFGFEASAWEEVRPQTGAVLDFTIPRRLL
ncbi:histidine phosphatase family protein [Phaeobacter sp. CNT1-3]|nr:histidine phosphatase family protein [Phaeobacter sp. CNT1-3]